MTEEELDRLASLIAKSLLDAQRAASSPGAASSANRKTWLPTPVRPEYRDRGEAAGLEPPVWSGAGQSLDDVAPGRSPPVERVHRVSTAELTNATRAAAAGRAQPAKTHAAGRAHPSGRSRSQDAPAIEVPIGISNRHIHLSQTHFRILFGADSPSAERPIKQPGQFAAKETVDVVAPAGRVEKVRVVGPARGETQVELALSDCRRIGITPPVAASGALAGSGGGVTLVGPAGSVPLTRGVIVASHHLHLSATDARRWGLHDGDRLDVRCGAGDRRVTLHDVLVRAGPSHATELHVDCDEAFAAGVKSGDTARILAWRAAPARKRPLVTERDVKEMALRAESLPPDAILTPSARDRARALNLLPP